MKLGEMTWPEVAALDKSNLVAVCPIAAFEQHGPHLPFLTDTMETDEVVARLERRLPGDRRLPADAVAGVLLPPTCASPAASPRPRRPHVNPDRRNRRLPDRGRLRPRVLIVNGHGGNQPDMAVALQKVKERYPDSRVFAVSHWKAAEPLLDEIREAGPHGWGHAGEMETSLMLAIRPDLVKEELPARDGTHPESEYGRPGVAVPAHGRDDGTGDLRGPDLRLGGEGGAHVRGDRRLPRRHRRRPSERQALTPAATARGAECGACRACRATLNQRVAKGKVG